MPKTFHPIDLSSTPSTPTTAAGTTGTATIVSRLVGLATNPWGTATELLWKKIRWTNRPMLPCKRATLHTTLYITLPSNHSFRTLTLKVTPPLPLYPPFHLPSYQDSVCLSSDHAAHGALRFR